MKNYKICVYAIAKNEAKFVNRWVQSVKDADMIFVLDTGSTDNTVELLKENGVNVTVKEIKPWRFDVARNESLKLVPDDADICICIDLDEILLPGWREALEKYWQKDTDRIFYNYNWNLDENDNPKVSFYIEKIHARHNYKWTHPVHEVLTYTGDGVENKLVIEDICVNHYPDNTKSRGSYLPLLEMSVEEDPNDDRNMHYLGREYMYYGRFEECIKTLKRHLNMKNATWKDERCASMRFIGRSYKNLKKFDEAIFWYEKAIAEAPYLRDSYVELALLYYQLENYDKVIEYCNKALEIKNKAKSYINEIFSWDNTIYDLKSIAYYYLGNMDKALENVNLAIDMNPNDERLINNKKFMEEVKKEKEN